MSAELFYNAYIRGVLSDNVDDKITECTEEINNVWDEILALMASSANNTTESNWDEYVVERKRELQERLEWAIALHAKLLQAKDAIERKFDDVRVCKNGHSDYQYIDTEEISDGTCIEHYKCNVCGEPADTVLKIKSFIDSY